ncbi:hypothetical protein F5X96DRAFT_673901 [Biscogniauxia mediterranea]|nr:hypothetical protein F5X96DRAFT_673901 [Biscogniauxia mediterranea]
MKHTDQNASSACSRAATYINQSAEQFLNKLRPSSSHDKDDIDKGRKSPDSLPGEARGIVSPSILSLDSEEEDQGEGKDSCERSEETGTITTQTATADPPCTSTNLDQEEKRANKQIDSLDTLFKPTLKSQYRGLYEKKHPQNKLSPRDK